MDGFFGIVFKKKKGYFIPNSHKKLEFGKDGAQSSNKRSSAEAAQLRQLSDAGGFEIWDAGAARFQFVGRVWYIQTSQQL